MHAERAALTHESIKQLRSVLRDAIIFEEELLKLIDEQQHAWQARGGSHFAIARNVLHARVTEQFAATSQLCIKSFKHAEAKLTITFNRHCTSVGK